MKKSWIFSKKVLYFLSLLWYVVVLTGGATYEQPDKRTMARKHNTTRGQQNELERDERTARIHGKASEDLEKTFTEEQKEILDKFHDCWSEYISLAEATIFEYAFKLGMQLAIEVLTE